MWCGRWETSLVCRWQFNTILHSTLGTGDGEVYKCKRLKERAKLRSPDRGERQEELTEGCKAQLSILAGLESIFSLHIHPIWCNKYAARSPDSSACEYMLSAKIGWRFSDGRDFCQKNAPTEGSRVLHRSMLMPPKLWQAADSFLKSSSYSEALLQTRLAQAAHPPSKLLGPKADEHLRVSETVCFWRKQEVLSSEINLCLFLTGLFWGRKGTLFATKH